MAQRKQHHFTAALAGGVALCAFVAVTVYFFLFRYTPEDEVEYRRLMLMSNPSLAGNASDPSYTARQSRHSVRKDFSYSKKHPLLKGRLLSHEAEFVLDRQAGTTQIIEKMHGVKAWLQEELFYVLPDGREAILQGDGSLQLRNGLRGKETSWQPSGQELLIPMQVIRVLEAEEGCYSYRTDACTAQNVVIKTLLLNGHELPDTDEEGIPIMTGTADTVEFKLEGEDPSFTASRLKTTLFLPERM